ncbi:hypothetical protein [Amycolatopsis arida]|uniref:hypothetical protein n=1 Tax=Amycolatopsis arida TaxID=587909 RepID=UPI000B813581|nr:hypothetical protein [Amycolatopsis arida]
MPLPSLSRRSSRSSAKSAGQGRHRDAKDIEPTVDDHELTSYLAALAPDSDPESTGSGRRFGDAQVYQLRLNLIASEQLKEIARERDTSPQALAQEWILERLSWEAQASAQQRHTARRRQRDDEPRTEEHFFDQRWPQPVGNGH